MKSRVFSGVLLLIVLVLGLSLVTLASGDEADSTFNIEIDIIQPLEIELQEHMDFGTVYTGVEESQVDSADFLVTGTEGAEIAIDYPDNTTLTSSATSDEILVGFYSATSAQLYEGSVSFSVNGEIASGELADIEAGAYEGQATVTVSYNN